jgi:hypothetical protein
MDLAFTAAGLVPEPNPDIRAELARFIFNYTFWPNIAFGVLAGYFFRPSRKHPMHCDDHEAADAGHAHHGHHDSALSPKRD